MNGKPRQDTVLILPTIRTCCLNDPMMRARWWHVVDGRIDWLGNPEFADSSHFIGAADAARIRTQLAATVPLPPPDVLAAHVAEEKARAIAERERIWKFADSFFAGTGLTTTPPMPSVEPVQVPQPVEDGDIQDLIVRLRTLPSSSAVPNL